MKSKHILLDDDQYDYLVSMRGDANDLIRKLLRGHMNSEKPKSETEIMKRIKQLEAKKEYEKRLKDIENGFVY